jgi:hypothetical protein
LDEEGARLTLRREVSPVGQFRATVPRVARSGTAGILSEWSERVRLGPEVKAELFAEDAVAELGRDSL